MCWLNERRLAERPLVLLQAPGIWQRVECQCLVGTSANVSPNNQRQGRKGPRAHLVHLTDAQRGCALAPITQPGGGRPGTQAQHSHCPGNISGGELMVLQFTSPSQRSESPPLPTPSSLHRVKAPSEHFSLLQGPESPGQTWGDWAPALSLTSYVTPGRSLHLAEPFPAPSLSASRVLPRKKMKVETASTGHSADYRGVGVADPSGW